MSLQVNLKYVGVGFLVKMIFDGSNKEFLSNMSISSLGFCDVYYTHMCDNLNKNL